MISKFTFEETSQALKFALGRCILLHTKFTCRQTSDTQIINDIRALESVRFRVLQATDKQVFSSSALLIIFPNLAVCQVKMTENVNVGPCKATTILYAEKAGR